jgi:hypothetical protein
MTEKVKPSLFIEGYLNDLYKSGYRPKYGYPNDGGLPKTNGRTMKIVSCFPGARRNEANL